MNYSFLSSSLWKSFLLAYTVMTLTGMAHGQIFVSYEGDTVGEYDLATGATINNALITGLNSPAGLAVSGGNLYIANYGNASGNGSVGVYTTSGVAVNDTLISGLNPADVIVSGGNLYVASGFNPGSGTVGIYTTSGTAVNASFITGLGSPVALALSGNNLFVVDNSGNSIGVYNATTGAVINASFITGLQTPVGLAVIGNDLFVTNFGNNTLGEYDATTGAVINAALITGLGGPNGLAATGTDLYIANFSNNTVGDYTLLGGTVNASLVAFPEVFFPQGVAVVSTPEPSSIALLILGLGFLAYKKTRRHRFARF